MAKKVYLEYMTTEAYHLALSPLSDAQPTQADIDKALSQNMEKLLQDAVTGHGSPYSSIAQRRNLPNTSRLDGSILGGDQALANSTLFMRDMLPLVEFDASIAEGDPGRMFSMMNVSTCAYKQLVIKFTPN
jgi:hypothetical protein